MKDPSEIPYGKHTYIARAISCSGVEPAKPTALMVYFPDLGKISLGDYCSISCNVSIFLGGNHRMDWISGYPFKETYGVGKNHETTKGDVVIGNDVWIGWGATIMSGVTIGDGSAISAFSIVTRDVPDYAIVAGNPARVVKRRFSPPKIKRLRDMQWWNWPEELVAKAIPLIQSADVEALWKFYKGEVMNFEG